jgi:hypothetical protein
MPSAQLGTVDENGFIWTVPRQIFVKLYVATGDVLAAARDAKLPKAEDPEELLRHKSVAAAVNALHEQVLRRVHETADTVISRYSNVAEADITDYIRIGTLNADDTVDPGNLTLRDWRTMPRHMRQRIKKIKTSTKQAPNDRMHTDFEIELHDPMKANDMLMRILRLDGNDAAGNDPKATAEAIHEFFKELDELDSHYVDPDDVPPEAS